MHPAVSIVRGMAIFSCAAPLLLALPTTAIAQDTDGDQPALLQLQADRSFGRHGSVRGIGKHATRLDLVGGIAIDASGRIVVSGSRQEIDGSWQGGVARFVADGTPDASFGDGGVAVLPVRGRITRLAIDSDGRIVVIGIFVEPGVGEWDPGTRWGAARLREDGSLDPTFSDDGVLETSDGPSPTWLQSFGVAAADGSLRVVSSNGLLRITVDGHVDPTFAGDGLSEMPILGYDMDVAPSGAVLVLTSDGILRYDADGARDLAFGIDGFGVDADGEHVGNRFGVDAEGRIVAIYKGAETKSGVYRLLPDGSLDASFGFGGRAPLSWGVPASVKISDVEFVVSRGPVARYVAAAPAITASGSLQGATVRNVIVQSFDPRNPRTVASYLARMPARVDRVAGVALAPDGSAAIVAVQLTNGRPLLFRVGLEPVRSLALPDFQVRFLNPPAVHDRMYGPRLDARLRVFNSGGGGRPYGVRIALWLSDDAVLDAGDTYLWYREVESTDDVRVVSQRLRLPVRVTADDVKGRHLIAVVNPQGEYAESDLGDNTIVWSFGE